MKILAIGAHPDDIEIFMYGLVAACKKRGDEIILCIATDGSAGEVKLKNNLKHIRERESVKGLKKLGFPVFLNLKDGNLAETPNAFKIINEFICKVNPDLIVTHDPFDYHSDHRSLSEFVSRSASFKHPLIFSETLMGLNFIPEIYVDITKFFEEKKNAILAHKSQNPGKFVNAIKLANRFRSAQCNVPEHNYAEVYRFSKTFPFADIRSLIPESPKLFKFYERDGEGFL